MLLNGIFISFLPSTAQRERPHAIPQTAECTDSTGLPQTPTGTSSNVENKKNKNIIALTQETLLCLCFQHLMLLLRLFSQVKLVNIRNDDIADGNPKLTLGLIWTIILHFQVSSSVSVVFHYIIALSLCTWDLTPLSCCFPSPWDQSEGILLFTKTFSNQNKILLTTFLGAITAVITH